MSRLHTMFFSPAAYHAGFHTGAWRALAAAGFDPFTCVGGGSVGSLLAFAIAGGVSLDAFDASLDDMAATWARLRGWGRHAKLLRPVTQGFIDQTTASAWQRDVFAVVTTAQLALPPVGPRFVHAPAIDDHEAIKRLVIASCRVPGMFEDAPWWEGRPAIDGCAFLMELTMPGVLTSSPWGELGPHVIAPERGSDEAAYVRRNHWQALAPGLTHVRVMRDIGAESARKWLARYG